MKFWKKNSVPHSLAIGAIFFGAFAGGFWLILNSPQDAGIESPLRHVLDFNSSVLKSVSNPHRLAKEFDPKQAGEPRVNGDVGMTDDFDPNKWHLEIEGDGHPIQVSIDDFKKLPYVEMTTDFKCVEGWSKIVNWGGVRLSDFLEHYHLLPAPKGSDWTHSPFSVALEM